MYYKICNLVLIFILASSTITTTTTIINEIEDTTLTSDQEAKSNDILYAQPEQIHLSLGENVNQMWVTWTTFNRTAARSSARFGVESFDRIAYGTATQFIDDGPERRTMYIHRVCMDDLQSNTLYKYHVGSDQGWSSVYYFRTFPSQSQEWSPRIVVFGDLGNVNGRTLGRLQAEAQLGSHHLALHLGDMAYDLHHDNARKGDQFMRQIEPIAAYLPYQVLPGNHENAYNFSNYVNRFSMRSQDSETINNHFWSYNIGPIHLIAFSTEFQYYPQYGTTQIENQRRWLEADLRRANEHENRRRQPWIVTAGHRAIYTHAYVNEAVRHEFEQLFYRYGVDLQLWAHEHIYERTWPIFNGTIRNITLESGHVYRNPAAPIHVTVGSAGCNHLPQTISSRLPEYTAFVNNEYGFLHMRVLNRTHIRFEQVSYDQKREIIDRFDIIKERHEPFEDRKI